MPDPIALLLSGARVVAPKLRALALGSVEQRGAEAAIAKAVWASATQALRVKETPSEDEIEFLSSTLLECIGDDALRTLRPAGATSRSYLGALLRERLAPLDQPTSSGESQLKVIGVPLGADEIAAVLVNELTENLTLWAGDKAHVLRDLGLELQSDRIAEAVFEEGRPVEVSGSPAEQARSIRAWISVETDPPQIEVLNRSHAPIYDVLPTPTLLAVDARGEVTAMVGGSPLWNSQARQISPGFGYVWPLPHMASWGGSPLVKSQLHLRFTDERGRRWLLGHDALSQLEEQPE